MPTKVDNRELKDLIYLDYNCFQRGFDDPRQIKIQLEALACEEIFAKAERKKVRLVWSFMHEDENILCHLSNESWWHIAFPFSVI